MRPPARALSFGETVLLLQISRTPGADAFAAALLEQRPIGFDQPTYRDVCGLASLGLAVGDRRTGLSATSTGWIYTQHLLGTMRPARDAGDAAQLVLDFG